MLTTRPATVCPSRASELGAKEQVNCAGTPLQLNETVLLKPLIGDTLRINKAVCPGVTVIVVCELGAKLKS